MMLVAITMVMSVVVTNIYAKKDSSDHVPRWCIAVVSQLYPRGIANETSRCTVERKIRNGVEELPEVDRERSKSVSESKEEWTLVAKFTDRLCFWFYVAQNLVVLTALLVQIVEESSDT